MGRLEDYANMGEQNQQLQMERQRMNANDVQGNNQVLLNESAHAALRELGSPPVLMTPETTKKLAGIHDKLQRTKALAEEFRKNPGAVDMNQAAHLDALVHNWVQDQHAQIGMGPVGSAGGELQNAAGQLQQKQSSSLPAPKAQGFDGMGNSGVSQVRSSRNQGNRMGQNREQERMGRTSFDGASVSPFPGRKTNKSSSPSPGRSNSKNQQGSAQSSLIPFNPNLGDLPAPPVSNAKAERMRDAALTKKVRNGKPTDLINPGDNGIIADNNSQIYRYRTPQDVRDVARNNQQVRRELQAQARYQESMMYLGGLTPLAARGVETPAPQQTTSQRISGRSPGRNPEQTMRQAQAKKGQAAADKLKNYTDSSPAKGVRVSSGTANNPRPNRKLNQPHYLQELTQKNLRDAKATGKFPESAVSKPKPAVVTSKPKSNVKTTSVKAKKAGKK